MKTVILNGSPRKAGDTSTLINAFTRHLQGEVKVVESYPFPVHPCIDCRACWNREGCSIQDGMQIIYNAVEEADVLVLASPLYFSTLTGPLLNLASRFQTYYATARFRKQALPFKPTRVGILLLVGGSERSVPESALKTARIILGTLRAPLLFTVSSLQTDTLPASEDLRALTELKSLAEELNRRFYSDEY